MADSTQQVVVEFVADTSGLQPGIDKLQQIGQVDEASAVIFKKTNDAIKARNQLLQASPPIIPPNFTASMTQAQQVFNRLVASLGQLTGKSKEFVQNLLNLSRTNVEQSMKDFADEISHAGLNLDEFIDKLKEAGGAQDQANEKTNTLRTELLQTTNALAELGPRTAQNATQFDALAKKGAQLSEAMVQARTVIKNLSTESPGLRLLSGSVQALSGAFATVQGATALFGEDGKDLQEVLVKVNGAMALSVGLSQLLNVANEQQLVSTAALVAANIKNNAQLIVNNGLQSESVVVRGAATAAQWLLNAAVAAFPLTAAVTVIAAAIIAFKAYANSTRDAADAQNEFNNTLKETSQFLDADISDIKRATDKILAGLDDRNAKESEKLDAQVDNIGRILAKRNRAVADADAFLAKNQERVLSGDASDEEIKNFEDVQKQKLKIQEDILNDSAQLEITNNKKKKALLVEDLQATKDTLDAKLSAAEKNSSQQFALQRQIVAAEAAIDIQAAGDNTQKIAAIQAAAARRQLDINIAQAKVLEDNKIAILQRGLIRAQNESRAINDRTSKEEIDRQNDITRQEAKFAAQAEGLTQQERAQIIDQANQEILQRNKAFRIQSATEALEDQKSLDQLIINDTKLTEQQKLEARIDSIFATAAIEIAANEGKTAKIKEIESKRDLDVKNARLASIQDTLQKELAFEAAVGDQETKLIERRLAAQDAFRSAENKAQKDLVAQRTGQGEETLQQQFADIDTLTQKTLKANELKREAARQTLEVDGNLAAFDQKAIELADADADAVEQGEQRKRDAISKTTEQRKKEFLEMVDQIAQFAKGGIDILQGIYDNQNEREKQNIDDQRKRIQDLQDSGAISAKEAQARNKNLDQEQKKLERQQAIRARNIAVFQATIATAEAVIKAYSTVGPIAGPLLAAIVGAIGAAQIAIIASKPLPSFKLGKNNSYEGPGIWGEAGAELMERDGKMYVASSPTLSYIKKDDVIYNPRETAAMLGARAGRGVIPVTKTLTPKQVPFDYEKLGKILADNVSTSGLIYESGEFREFVKKGNSFTKYLSNRRKWD